MENNYKVYVHITPNNKRYIGITIRKPERRWNNGKGYEKNKCFYNTILKYGWNNIKHEVLFEGLTKKQAESKEIELIAFYKSNTKKFGYNVDNGGNCVGSHSEKTRLKIGLISAGRKHTEESKEKIRQAILGRKHTEESKKRMRIAQQGRRPTEYALAQAINAVRGKKQSEETIRKKREKMKGRKPTEKNRIALLKATEKPVFQFDLDMNFIAEYRSIAEASKVTNIAKQNICRNCMKKSKITAAGFYLAI